MIKIVVKRQPKSIPVCAEDCELGEVVVVEACCSSYYLVARVDGAVRGINLDGMGWVDGKCTVLRKVSAEVHVDETGKTV